MPTWGVILNEIQALAKTKNLSATDEVRRKYLGALAGHTKRNVILYASRFTQPTLPIPIPPDMVSISEEDTQGLMEVIHGLEGNELDLILHSPGGSLEATEAFVAYLRTRFSHIRAFIPHLAMSGATLIALASDEIYMGKHSFLGPTDPQLALATQLGPRMIPAQAVIEQFKQAQNEFKNPEKRHVWFPILPQYGPDLLVRCEHAKALSVTCATNWLASYMFKGDADAKEKAKMVAEWLADHGEFRTHGRHLSRDDLRERGIKVLNLESDEIMRDLVLSVFHATTHTFSLSFSTKIIENHHGRAFVRAIQPPQANPKVPAIISFPQQFQKIQGSN